MHIYDFIQDSRMSLQMNCCFCEPATGELFLPSSWHADDCFHQLLQAVDYFLTFSRSAITIFSLLVTCLGLCGLATLVLFLF
jgi:hypothetical protein